MSVRPRKFRKRPVEVEAVRFSGGSGPAASIVRWILDNGGKASYETVAMNEVTGVIAISTLEGRMLASPGDIIIRGVAGEFYPCKPDIFEQTYETTTPYTLSDANRMLLYRAYDDGDGSTVTIQAGSTDDYFVGMYEDMEVMEGVQIDGTLYSICPQSGGGLVTVLVGEEIVQNVVGPTFSSFPEARAYIKGLTTK